MPSAGRASAATSPGSCSNLRQTFSRNLRQNAGLPLPILSAVALGNDADASELARLARVGNGTLLFVGQSPTPAASKLRLSHAIFQAAARGLGHQRVGSAAAAAGDVVELWVEPGARELRVNVVGVESEMGFASLFSPDGSAVEPLVVFEARRSPPARARAALGLLLGARGRRQPRRRTRTRVRGRDHRTTRARGRGGLWSSDAGVHLMWKAYRLYKDTNQVQYIDDTETWLAQTTISPEGDVSHAVHALFPPETRWDHTGAITVAGRPDGVFAVGHDWWDGEARPLRVALGRVNPPQLQPPVVLPVDGEPLVIHTAATWDGEAFALHAYGAPPQFTQHVARVDDQGNVLLPFTQYAVANTATVEFLGHALSTSADSGNTFLLEPGKTPRLYGHTRDGQAMPGPPKQLAASVDVQTSVAKTSIRTDAEGAWVAWSVLGQTGYEVRLQRVDSAGDPVAPQIPLPFQPMGSDGIAFLALVSRGSSVVALAPTSVSLYRFVYDGETLSEPERVLSPGSGLDIRNVEAIEHEGEIWLSYYHASTPQYLRVLKAIPGCVYPPRGAGL